MRTAITGSVVPVTQAMTGSLYTLSWAFATGECGSENWGGMNASTFASVNVPLFVNAGKRYIVSTGGAAGSFTCGTDAGFTTFIERYKSANLVGIDFDIENNLTQAQIDSLIQRVKNAETKYPGLRFTFTLATLGQNNGQSSTAVEMCGSAPNSLNALGTLVMQRIKANGLTNYRVNLMTMDYGTGTNVCVMNGGKCDIGQSAIQAAMNFHNYWGVSYFQTELTPMIGTNDVTADVFTTADATTMDKFATWNGIQGVHYWSLDRDTGLTFGNQFGNQIGQ